MQRALLLFYLSVFSCGLSMAAYAHELQGVALNLQEDANGHVQASLKIQARRDGQVVNLLPLFSPDCQEQGPAQLRRLGDQVLRQWSMRCDGGLPGRSLRIDGLGPSVPDAIVNIGFAHGGTQTVVLDRENPQIQIGISEEAQGPGGLLAYFPIGIEHILLGPDHLLFVLCLLLLLGQAQRGLASVLATITAFTLAHSLTLGLTVWQGWSLPSSPVEAVIALSILLLAAELARNRQSSTTSSLSLRFPALIAFAFGLLHGFGFAGALKEIGLPEAAQGWALLLFNLGVEAGQLLFVLAVLLLAWLMHRPLRLSLQAMSAGLVLLTGTVSAFWFIDRLQPVLGL
ncbi:MAG: HupE/UreJ family protein [Nevskiales bacterium]